MNLICCGDSNTFGYDPRSRLGGRYAPDCRWVDILAERSGWIIQNDGINGREIPEEKLSFPDDTDLLIMMLGTNDLLQGRTAQETAERMERFLSYLTIDRSKILLIAPPPMKRGAWVPDEELIRACSMLAECYRSLAVRLHIRFLDAGAWNIPLCFDGVHLTEEGHRILADHLYRELMV